MALFTLHYEKYSHIFKRNIQQAAWMFCIYKGSQPPIMFCSSFHIPSLLAPHILLMGPRRRSDKSNFLWFYPDSIGPPDQKLLNYEWKTKIRASSGEAFMKPLEEVFTVCEQPQLNLKEPKPANNRSTTFIPSLTLIQTEYSLLIKNLH